jgi:hypothetical protein
MIKRANELGEKTFSPEGPIRLNGLTDVEHLTLLVGKEAAARRKKLLRGKIGRIGSRGKRTS